ncbi:queuosine precursor transporter [Methanoplanus sp. FWC-SCC4]|uniref:Probable queuosine precursor transporter n=1 Tax=Methanochimaera problematica TaxID=2609417 RepID=A0AA97FF40_9EURY|nr:queuosine precursor transporter [Methanoplanus sp. FWC-SCC4]WOF17133.1 queuosine precursor transporter [Methanoplanus sp. FWC-SCC4]
MLKTTEEKTVFLISLYIAALIVANLLGNKITDIGGIVVSVAIFSYPVTFLVTDIIAEVHGEKKSKALVMAGTTALIFVLVLTALSVALPPATRFPFNDSYTDIFGSSLRLVFASIVSFAVSQTHDVWSFHFWKRKTNGRHLWLRNNISTATSQLIDTTIFMFIAFYMAAPMYTAGFIVALIIPYWIVKVIMALFDTPLCYLGVKWLKNSSE